MHIIDMPDDEYLLFGEEQKRRGTETADDVDRG